MTRPWEIRRQTGDVGEFHAEAGLHAPVARSATFVTAVRPTLVRGSSQTVERIDAATARRLGVDVVARRSGGGAVLLVPEEFVWLDMRIGVDDPLWCDDVAQAMVWVGETWQAALAALGVDGHVHRGALQSSRWSDDVCWAGRGTGEVVGADGAKLVGVSQRRSRSGARFQSLAHLVWRADLVADLVADPRPEPSALARCAAVVPATRDALEAALVAALP